MSFILCLPRIIGHALLGAGLLLLVGCSTLRVAYDQSDSLLFWWVDRYLDLRPEQKPPVKAALADLQRWHRSQQLPDYMRFAQRMRVMAERDITADEVCALTQEMQASYQRLLDRIEPAATELLVQLQADQLRHLRKRYDSSNEEWRDEWMDGSADKRLRHRIKQAQGRLEDFYGRFDTTQRNVLEHWIRSAAFDPAMNYGERLRRQTDSLQTLERMTQIGSASAVSQALLHAWVERSLLSPDQTYRNYAQSLWQQNCAGFAKLHNSTTLEQRLQFAQTMQRYENDFRALMRSATP